MDAVVGTPFSHIDKASLASKILHILKVFPYLSPSMLQVGVGTALPPTIWKPVLEELISQKVVHREQKSVTNLAGKSQMYTIIRLSTTAPIHIIAD